MENWQSKMPFPNIKAGIRAIESLLLTPAHCDCDFFA
jgi:hypothetical protein